MNTKLFCVLCMTFFIGIGTQNVYAEDIDFSMIIKRVAEDLLSKQTPLQKEELAVMKDDGSYEDIDYYSTVSVNWQPELHLTRLYQYAVALVHPESELCGVDSLKEQIVRGLQYWYDVHPKSSNWWYNEIAVPQDYGQLLMLLDANNQQIPSELLNKILSRWEEEGGDPAKKSSSNRANVALHWFYRGCIGRNNETINVGLQYAFEPVKYTTGEGFQVDNSFHSHGHQLFIGAYSETLMSSVLSVAKYVQGTNISLSDDKLELLRNYVLGTYSNVIRGKGMNFDCLGREMSKVGALQKPYYYGYVKLMQEADKERASDYQPILDRLSGEQPASFGITPYHVHFWKSDYTIHVRPKYNFSVRSVTTRTGRCESYSSTGENLKVYYLSDGCTDIARTGKEYVDLLPFWNWNKVPGITSPQLDTIPIVDPPAWFTPGTSDFAGGVNDSIYGLSAYRYYDTYQNINTGANKGYFFFDDEVVCLGSNIKSDYDVCTSINQCRGKERFAVLHQDSNDLEIYSGEAAFTDDKIKAVVHDSIGYIIDDMTDIEISNQEKDGNWYWINTNMPDSVMKEKVFTLSINHGIKAEKSNKYAYIVVPGLTENDINDYISHNAIEVLENSDTIQAVYHHNLDIAELVFYKAGQLGMGETKITVSRPCLMMLNGLEKETLRISVADPIQSGEDLAYIIEKPEVGHYQETINYSTFDKQYYGKTISSAISQTTDINISKADRISDLVQIYTVNGIRVYSGSPKSLPYRSLSPGVYILREVDGLSRKILVK